jgi:hypothetical protein
MSKVVIDFRNPCIAKDALIKHTCDLIKKNPFCTVPEAQEFIKALDKSLCEVDAQVKAHVDAQRDIANDERKIACDGKSK